MSRSSLALTAIVLTLAALTAGASASGQAPTVAAPSRAPPPVSGAAPRAAPTVATVLVSRAASVPSPTRGKRRGHAPSLKAPLRWPLAALDRANAEARDGPSSGAFVNSALYHHFEPGRLYTIHTSPRFLTTITLKPGEKLIAKAAGDTVRWVIGETEAGAGEAVQVVIFVKPIRADLRTNIVLTTDQRTYLIEAASSAGATYTSALSWNYPQDLAREAAARREQALTAVSAQAAAVVAEAVPADRLNFRYRIEPRKKRAPAWTPVRVFDDGTKTYIEFPADLTTREAPPLFLLGQDDQAQLVNYRQKGVYYVVDHLIERAELRLGDEPQGIVRITRDRGVPVSPNSAGRGGARRAAQGGRALGAARAAAADHPLSARSDRRRAGGGAVAGGHRVHDRVRRWP
jgi:P-type conjugative transfer protein TrbG